MENTLVTVITPTTGKNGLFRLVESLKKQSIPVKHIILWDSKREGKFLFPDTISMKTMSPFDMEVKEGNYESNCIVVQDKLNNGIACGSALRAVGLMIANTEYVTFADDDVMWEENHLRSMIELLNIENKKWGFCQRTIWTTFDKNGEEMFEYLGVDQFESVGEDAKTPYKMVDNNCMIFNRRLGTSAACLYRETKDYNDDRLMYDFLKKYGGEPSKTFMATINQICPKNLIEFFRQNCNKNIGEI